MKKFKEHVSACMMILMNMIIVCTISMSNITKVYADTATQTVEETTKTTTETLSDGKMILVLLAGMMTMAAIVVFIAWITGRKNNLNDYGRGGRDVF